MSPHSGGMWKRVSGLETEIFTFQEMSCGVGADIAWPVPLEHFLICSSIDVFRYFFQA